MKKLLIATTNTGKINEIKTILNELPLELMSLDEFPDLVSVDVEETGDSFAENALIKAHAYADMTNIMTLADDSGLSVDALHGRPGIFSKRYGTSDAARIIRLLDELQTIPGSKRSAHFTSAAAVYDPFTGLERVFEGRVEGLITDTPSGTNGFGYDPVFYCPEIGKTFGEALETEKNLVSHRFRALVQMRDLLMREY